MKLLNRTVFYNSFDSNIMEREVLISDVGILQGPNHVKKIDLFDLFCKSTSVNLPYLKQQKGEKLQRKGAYSAVKHNCSM